MGIYKRKKKWYLKTFFIFLSIAWSRPKFLIFFSCSLTCLLFFRILIYSGSKACLPSFFLHLSFIKSHLQLLENCALPEFVSSHRPINWRVHLHCKNLFIKGWIGCSGVGQSTFLSETPCSFFKSSINVCWHVDKNKGKLLMGNLINKLMTS